MKHCESAVASAVSDVGIHLKDEGKKKIATFPIVASCASRGRRCKNFDERRRSGPGTQAVTAPGAFAFKPRDLNFIICLEFVSRGTANSSNDERPIPSFRIGNNVTKNVSHRGGGMSK